MTKPNPEEFSFADLHNLKQDLTPDDVGEPIDNEIVRTSPEATAEQNDEIKLSRGARVARGLKTFGGIFFRKKRSESEIIGNDEPLAVEAQEEPRAIEAPAANLESKATKPEKPFTGSNSDALRVLDPETVLLGTIALNRPIEDNNPWFTPPKRKPAVQPVDYLNYPGTSVRRISTPPKEIIPTAAASTGEIPQTSMFAERPLALVGHDPFQPRRAMPVAGRMPYEDPIRPTNRRVEIDHVQRVTSLGAKPEALRAMGESVISQLQESPFPSPTRGSLIDRFKENLTDEIDTVKEEGNRAVIKATLDNLVNTGNLPKAGEVFFTRAPEGRSEEQNPDKTQELRILGHPTAGRRPDVQ